MLQQGLEDSWDSLACPGGNCLGSTSLRSHHVKAASPGATHPRVPAYFLAARSVAGPHLPVLGDLVQWSPVSSEDMLSVHHQKREGEHRFLWEQKSQEQNPSNLGYHAFICGKQNG